MNSQFPSRSHASQHGVALIITLFFLMLITVAVIGLIDAARVERPAAASHFERMRATNLAQQGIELPVATLRRETTDPARNWVSQPGGLVVPNDLVSAQLLKTQVPLSSGAPTALPPNAPPRVHWLEPANLNVQTLADQGSPTHLLIDGDGTNPAPEMKLRWIYVRQNPVSSTSAPENNYDYSETPNTTDRNYPIVGRFAYWTDDESAKVNYNLAWSRGKNNTFPTGNQTKVDLRALQIEPQLYVNDAIADKIHQSITPDTQYKNVNRFFNSPFDVRQLGTSTANLQKAMSFNRFNLTHFNSDPDTTYYGKWRMMLTTQLSNAILKDKDGNQLMQGNKAVTRPFLDILKRPNDTTLTYIDPGVESNVDALKVEAVVKELINNYLKRSDWPIVDGVGHSLQEKYYSNYTGAARDQRLAQLALNIIDYVRSAESAQWIVEPLRAKWLGADFRCDFFPGISIRGTEDTFKGLTRGPQITEMGMWISTKPETAGANKDRYHCLGFVEMHLPENYGIDEINIPSTKIEFGSTRTVRWKLYFGEFSSGNYHNRSGGDAKNEDYIDFWPNLAAPTASSAFIWDAIANPVKKTLKPGDYCTLAIEAWSDRKPEQFTNVQLRAAISMVGTGVRIDVAPLGSPSVGSKPMNYMPTSDPNPGLPAMSYETNDPRVNGVPAAWTYTSSSFGRVNGAQLASVGQRPLGIVPEQDLDASGKITRASMRMPYPKGHTTNKNGRVYSSGELGLIHTGIEGSSSAPSGGVPWRSLHLQPNKQATTVVPDWAFMDLFTVPVDVPDAAAVIFAPHGTATGGRINMNAKPIPFELDRVDPLVCALLNCRFSSASTATLSLAKAQEIAGNIYRHGPLAAQGKLYPASAPQNVYESPGEVAEIKGVADGGEESEELIREIANLITARGNVFSIYSVGQALKQTADGKLLITAEQRYQAFVERFLDNKNTATDTDDEIRIRTVYCRPLTR